jgi:hypothetical protein
MEPILNDHFIDFVSLYQNSSSGRQVNWTGIPHCRKEIEKEIVSRPFAHENSSAQLNALA